MKTKLKIFTTTMLVAVASSAMAEGELNIFNWGNYTNPDMIAKFEKEYDAKVTITDYDSNTTALAKVKAGGHGYDIVVPSGSYIPIWIEDGLLMESKPNEMENFKNIDPVWVDVEFDKGRNYTIPWQWGTVGMEVNTSLYSGDINTSSIIFDTPDELKGKVNVVPEMADLMALAIYYVGGEQCTSDKETLSKVRDVLVASKANWISMEYGTIENFINGDFGAGSNWNGAAMRARLQNPDIAFGYPVEGYPVWMDNLAILADATNVDNAKAFMNFMMEPENAAMNSNFTRYANGVLGSAKFMDPDMATAPEVVTPDEFKAAGRIAKTCPKEATDIYTQIWTELQK